MDTKVKLSFFELTHDLWRSFAHNTAANAILGTSSSVVVMDLHHAVDDWLTTGGKCTFFIIGVLTIVNITITIRRDIRNGKKKKD